MNSIKKHQKGFSLVELLIAIFVFAIGLEAIFGVNIQSTQMAQQGDLTYKAYNLAKNRVETLRAMNFNDLPSADEASILINENGVPDPSGSFVRSTVVWPSFLNDPNLTQVSVTVFYRYRGVISRAPMEMTTVIYNG